MTVTRTRTHTFTETIPERIVRLALLEKEAAEAKHGVNSWPLGTGHPPFKALRDHYQQACEEAFADGRGTWAHIGLEEFFETLAEEDPSKFAHEALQTIGVLVSMVEDAMRQHPDLTLPPPF